MVDDAQDGFMLSESANSCGQGSENYQPLCPKASYITRAAAIEALSEVIIPVIGIDARESHLLLTKSDSPLPSLPTTIAVGNLKSTWLYGISPVRSMPTTHIPLHFNANIVWEILDTRATGTYSTAPADALATVAVSPTALLERIITP